MIQNVQSNRSFRDWATMRKFNIHVCQICTNSKNNIHQDQTLHIHNNKSKLLYVTVTSTNESYFKYESKIIPQFIFDQNYQPSVDIRKYYHQIFRGRLWQKQGVQGQKTQDFTWGFDCLSITFSHGVAVWGFFQVWLVGCTNAHLL